MVAGWLLPMFLSWFGFVSNVPQTPGALLGLTLAFSLVPGFFALLKAVALWVYPLRRPEVDRIERELGARRAAVAADAPVTA
jgi:GPH family glycoside/pentoside/hexuronide:cation symporter